MLSGTHVRVPPFSCTRETIPSLAPFSLSQASISFPLFLPLLPSSPSPSSPFSLSLLASSCDRNFFRHKERHEESLYSLTMPLSFFLSPRIILRWTLFTSQGEAWGEPLLPSSREESLSSLTIPLSFILSPRIISRWPLLMSQGKDWEEPLLSSSCEREKSILPLSWHLSLSLMHILLAFCNHIERGERREKRGEKREKREERGERKLSLFCLKCAQFDHDRSSDETKPRGRRLQAVSRQKLFQTYQF